MSGAAAVAPNAPIVRKDVVSRTTTAQCAPVVWAWVVRGTALPDFDADPGPLGTACLLDCGGDLVAFEGTAGGPQHASHFATCPERETWRQRRADVVEEAA